MNTVSEGVIKFNLDHEPGAVLANKLCYELRAWFLVCHRLDLLGQHPDRYEGYAFGNLSRRWQDGFVITCTQTSGKSALAAEDFAWVKSFDLAANRLRAAGPCKASSEAMTHGMIYAALPWVEAVFHAHTPVIWQQAQRMGIPVTDPAVEYGTPEMAWAVESLLAEQKNTTAGIFSMGGHEDGVISYGATVEAAGLLMIETLVKSHAAVLDE